MKAMISIVNEKEEAIIKIMLMNSGVNYLCAVEEILKHNTDDFNEVSDFILSLELVKNNNLYILSNEKSVYWDLPYDTLPFNKNPEMMPGIEEEENDIVVIMTINQVIRQKNTLGYALMLGDMFNELQLIANTEYGCLNSILLDTIIEYKDIQNKEDFIIQDFLDTALDFEIKDVYERLFKTIDTKGDI